VRERLDVEATDLFLLWAVDWFAVVGGGSVFACADEFASVLGTELSDAGAAEFSAEFAAVAGCG
jgi:hypothetical protein